MNYKDTMDQLKKLGTAQDVKIYKNHGSGDNVYGVSFADLKILKKKIKFNTELALQLWDSGNADARSLATMIVDPSEFKPADAERWIKEIDYYLLSDLLAGLISKTTFANQKMSKWMKAKNEYQKAAGYALLASSLVNKVDIPDSECKTVLDTIKKEIHSSPNRARHSMNYALITIGIYKPKLTEKAMKYAEVIGKVKVDHGATSCKTPDAIPYIKKALARKKK